MNDLWEKYFPFLGDAIDEKFDGTFPVVTYENATELHNGYLLTNTCYYRLKWKQRTFTANFYYPVYSSADTIAETKFIRSERMIYVPSLKYFLVLTDEIVAPDIDGKKYKAFVSTSGLEFSLNYYNADPEADAFKGIDIAKGKYPSIQVDTESQLYLDDFELIKNGADFVATYSDTNVFTETYVLETETVKRVKVEYKPFDYVNKTIRPIPPKEFEIDAEFVSRGNTYVVKGYRDINPADESKSRYYDVDSMPEVGKNRIYYVLFERKGLSELPVYYVNIVANGQKIGDYGVKQGEPIDAELIKANFYGELVVSRLAGYPLSQVSEAIKSISVTWGDMPDRMQDKDITVNLTVVYEFNDLSAEFVVSDPLQSFERGVEYRTDENGDRVHVETGGVWTFGSTDEKAFYSFPKLNDYFDLKGKKYFVFYGWKNEIGEEMPYGIRTVFVKNEVYTPIFVEKTVIPTIAFVSVGDYGYEYYYRIIEGDYYGKTLAEVIRAEKIDSPVRGDVNGIYAYDFVDWGVDANAYEIGSEKDIGGNVKTYLVFNARFTQKYMQHAITFEALGGAFSGGEKTLEKTGGYGEDLSLIAPEDYSDEKGDFTFVCWTTVPYSLDHRVDKADLKIGNADVTYYAYYLLDPASITLTFKGGWAPKEEADADDPEKIKITLAKVDLYFNGDKSKTELSVSDLYGRGYYLTASEFAVDSKSLSYVPDYLRWTIDGEEYVSAFYNDGYMAYVPFDHDATIEIVFKPATAKIVNIAFVSDGECFELDGTKIEGVVCNGFMSGFRHVANYYQEYGSSMTAPEVDYYSAEHYRFDKWETKPEAGSAPISVRAGETIIFEEDAVFYGVYVHDTEEKVRLTFRAESYSSLDGERGDKLTGLKIFADGSVEITDFGTAGENVTFDKTPKCKGMAFVGWTTDGKDLITQSELAQTTYSTDETYYAVYEAAPDRFEVTLYSGDGKFADGKTEKDVSNVPFGELTCNLEKPTPNASGLVFSHYEDENGYPVTAIEKGITLYARYAKPISTFEELQNVNLAPDQNYVLLNDVKASEDGSIMDESKYVSWTALGANAKNGFSGTFNGNGFGITIYAKSGTDRNFGLFHKLGGTVYNLSAAGAYSIEGSTAATALGGFVGEVTESGRIIDCFSATYFTVSVKATQKLSVAGSIGINNGLIDGLMSLSAGQIYIDGNKEFAVGSAVGSNFGKMKNVNQSSRGGQVNVSLARSLNCNIGAFIGYNSGSIENCLSERAIKLDLAQGDNLYLANSVILGGFAGKNDGTIVNSTALYGKLDYSVHNLTLSEEKGLYLSYDPDSEYPYYIIYAVGTDNQGLTYKTKYVIYLDDDAKKSESTEWKEFTLSEFKAAYPADAKKIIDLRNSIVFEGFVSENNGKTDNCTVNDGVGTGNGDELIASCGFDELKWTYVSRLYVPFIG